MASLVFRILMTINARLWQRRTQLLSVPFLVCLEFRVPFTPLTLLFVKILRTDVLERD